MAHFLQILVDGMDETKRKIEPQVVADWDKQFVESVKSPEFATNVFNTWTSKINSEKLLKDISKLYDGTRDFGNSWTKIQKALNVDIKDLEYTIAVFAKCTMSLTQENLEKIMPEAIRNLAEYKHAAFSKDSMPNFFKTVQSVLETIKNRTIVSRCGHVSNSIYASF